MFPTLEDAKRERQASVRKSSVAVLPKRAKYDRLWQIAIRNERLAYLAPAVTERPQYPLGKALRMYLELRDAGELSFLSPEQSLAELDETIENGKNFDQSLAAEFKILSH